MSEKDDEQDLMIRKNTEQIRQNADAIKRQTECLEKIRDHYFPQLSIWKRGGIWFLKAVGIVALYAGLMESGEWIWNTRQMEQLASRSAGVAKQLFFSENDPVGAVRFLEKAVELDGDKVKYRTTLAYVKGISAIVDFFDLGRPFTPDERARVDEILAEAVFLQAASPDEPMPYVLGAQAYVLRGEKKEALAVLDRALACGSADALVRANACAVRFFCGDYGAARGEIEEAARLTSDLPLVPYWRAMLAERLDRDRDAARRHVAELVKLAPRLAVGHLLQGRLTLEQAKPDFAAARAALARALAVAPKLKPAMFFTARSYEWEGNLTMARLWLDRALEIDGTYMNGLVARARVCKRLGDTSQALADLTAAIALAPFRADLRRMRAEVRLAAGEIKGADEDSQVARALAQAAN